MNVWVAISIVGTKETGARLSKMTTWRLIASGKDVGGAEIIGDISLYFGDKR